MIEAVPHGELIGPGHLLVDLSDEVGAMQRVWVYAGAHRRARIVDGTKPRVDHLHVLIANRDQASLVEQSPLEVREVERPILDQRPADTPTILLLIHRQLL